MRYEWNRAGIDRAVEDAMREHPELAERYWVAESRDSNDFTWHVELDPYGERRIARLTWEMIDAEDLEEIAAALATAGEVDTATFA
jgi:hypothetical protein